MIKIAIISDKKKIMKKTFYSLFYFYILRLAWATQYQVFISNQASPPYNGTALNPFSTLYSAFDYVVNKYNSSVSHLDEFYFILIQANASEPFYLTDGEISNGETFKFFLGKNIFHKY